MAYNLGQIDPEERTDLYPEPPEEEYPPRSQRLLRIGVAIVVMGLFAGGLWFAYSAGMRHGSGSANSDGIPLIRADTQPMKVRPDNPGGMQIPDRDMLIYGQQRPEVEHLLPPPEQPMARPAPPPPPIPTSAPQQPAQIAAAPPPATPTAPPATSPATETPAPVAAPPPLTPAAAAAAKLLAVAAVAPRQEPAAARAAAARGGGVRLQLGAVRSESEARGEWERLKHNNADLLRNLSGVAIRADLGDKGIYYRIQAGPVADASAADRICGELRQRHLACIIVR